MRGVLRAAGFIGWTLGVGGAWLCVRALSGSKRHASGGAFTLHVWSRGLCRLLGIRIEVRGIPCRGPVLRVGNHRGYLDVIVLAATAPALFVSKDDLAGWPVLGFLGKSAGTLFLDRTRPRAVTEVGEGMRALLSGGARGQAVILFPEGTTTAGNTVQPFHSSLFEPALRAGAAVQGAALAYAPRDPRDPPDLAAWTGGAAFVPHLWRLFQSRGLHARVVFQEPVSDYADRRAAAAGTREWITEELAKRAAAGTKKDSTQPRISGKIPPHGFGDAAGFVRGVAHRLRRLRHGHRASSLAQQGHVIGRIPNRHSL